MKKERDEKKEREARLLKRQQLKILSQSLVARRNLGEYMGNDNDLDILFHRLTVNGQRIDNCPLHRYGNQDKKS